MIHAKDFLDVAQNSLQQDSEVHWRTAVSRAYYACYHECESLCVTKSIPMDSDLGSHKKVIEALKGHTTPLARQIGNSLERRKWARVAADYRLRDDFEKANAKQEIIEAARLLKKVEDMLCCPAASA